MHVSLCSRRDQFERGQTHDRLWNAAQLEMVHMGKMNGFMRCGRKDIDQLFDHVFEAVFGFGVGIRVWDICLGIASGWAGAPPYAAKLCPTLLGKSAADAPLLLSIPHPFPINSWLTACTGRRR